MKSIFIRKVFQAKYKVFDEYTYKDKTNKVSIGRVEYDNHGRFYYNDNDILEKEIILECDLSEPMLDVGDNIFSKELNKNLYIYESIRTTDDTVEYVVERLVKDTETSLARRREIEYSIFKHDEQVELIDKLTDELSDIKTKLEEAEKEIKILKDNKVGLIEKIFGSRK